MRSLFGATPSTPALEPLVVHTGMRTPLEVINAMEPFVEEQLALLRPVDVSWQPSDVLPTLTTESWHGEIRQLRERAQGLPNDVLVVLVGGMVTEEALPAYQTMFNRHLGVLDRTGASDTSWARWSRGWTAEENRHGDLLNKYLYLSGRVDMHAVERTTQHLLRNGFDPHTGNDPYQGLVYTAFQERATKCSHSNVARLAMRYGEEHLGRICNMIAGDEARHEEAYKRFVGKIIELDPAGAVLAIAQMMRTRIEMPGRRMADSDAPDLFGQFSTVAQRLGVYTVRDYAQVIEHLVEYWRLRDLAHLTGEAARAQAYLCGLAASYVRMADRMEHRIVEQPVTPCSWIFGHPA